MDGPTLSLLLLVALPLLTLLLGAGAGFLAGRLVGRAQGWWDCHASFQDWLERTTPPSEAGERCTLGGHIG